MSCRDKVIIFYSQVVNRNMLSHHGEEAGVVVRGRIELTIGSQTKVLSAGDAYYFDSRLPHRFRNLDAETCEIVSVCTPPSF
jgi:mannose-6-phosphate isomerase-like protein (cupin superfamily)